MQEMTTEYAEYAERGCKRNAGIYGNDHGIRGIRGKGIQKEMREYMGMTTEYTEYAEREYKRNAKGNAGKVQQAGLLLLLAVLFLSLVNSSLLFCSPSILLFILYLFLHFISAYSAYSVVIHCISIFLLRLITRSRLL